MARVALTLNRLLRNGNIADPTGTAAVAGAGNGLQIANPGSDPFYLRVANATGGALTISALAGSQPSAISSGQAPIVSTVAATTTDWVGPFESAQTQQPDGSFIFETSGVLTVTAFQIDKNAV